MAFLPKFALGLCVASFTMTGLASAQDAVGQSPVRSEPRQGPSLVMQSAYAGTIAVQAFDTYATFKVLDAGGHSGNSLIRPLTERRPAFVAFKAGIAAATIYFGHNISKRSKVKAVVTIAGINAVYLAFGVHNYRLANRAQPR